MILSFELTMPNVGSWNGKWSGAAKKYYKHRTIGVQEIRALLGPDKERRSFHYSFGDGWGANVSVEQVSAREKARRERVSAGFYGYEWMISSILEFGKILNAAQQDERRKIIADLKKSEQARSFYDESLSRP
jgi:hypothetical protein